MQRAVSIRNQKYFPNTTGNECFNSAIANLLVELGDIETARYFFTEYRKHELVKDGSIDQYLSTRVVNDIIGDRYSPKLFVNFPDNFNYKTRKYFVEEQSRIIEEEISEKRILNIKNPRIEGPYCIIFQKEMPDLCHVVVYTKEGYCIDDGRLNMFKDLKITGIIRLSRI